MPGDEFHERDGSSSVRRIRSRYPTLAEPSPLLLQLPQVVLLSRPKAWPLDFASRTPRGSRREQRHWCPRVPILRLGLVPAFGVASEPSFASNVQED